MRRLNWHDILGWDREDHAAAWAAFAVTADLIGVKGVSATHENARQGFEHMFDPYEVVPTGKAFYTGYYEPEIAGSLKRSPRFTAALYAKPKGFKPPAKWHTRAEIAAGNLLAGYELVYVETPYDAFMAQVQGSVRVRLEDGSVLRLGFAAKNGHPYRSIGKALVEAGVAPAGQMTPERIRQWCKENPGAVQGLFNKNPSFVFFRPLDLPPLTGPIGAAGRPVLAGRTLAVDPAIIRLGSPVWVDCPGFGARLMVAQDAGSAIRGAGRGDLYFGAGPEAGRAAGSIRHNGSMIWLKRRT